MEDVPPQMPQNAYGAFEPEGMCIWINSSQGELPSHIGVISHEFAHYIQTISTLDGISNLLTLMFGIHSRIQRLEDLDTKIRLPIRSWTNESDCPSFVQRFMDFVEKRQNKMYSSYACHIDPHPPASNEALPIYHKGNFWYIVVPEGKSPVAGVPIGRLTLMEGMAVAAKCQTLGNHQDIEEKIANQHWHYIAPHVACRAVTPNIDTLLATKYLCDISLCSPGPGRTFIKGLRALDKFSNSASILNLERLLTQLYDQDCRSAMLKKFDELQRVFDILPPNHVEGNPSWTYITLRNALYAFQERNISPTSLAAPAYKGIELYELAKKIGSPVILTNDMRLSLLYPEESMAIHQAIFCVRAISVLCNWIMEGGQLICPYAGCPGCPPERISSYCRTDARKVIVHPDDANWCLLSFAARQLRIAEIVRTNIQEDSDSGKLTLK